MSINDLKTALWFWQVLPDRTSKGDQKTSWKTQLRADLESLDDIEAIRALSGIYKGRYDEHEGTRGSVASRASSRLIFVGVVTTGTVLVASALEPLDQLARAAVLVVGAMLLYSCVAVAYLAVRAQEVTTWELPRVNPRDAEDQRTLAVTYAVEIMAAAEQNQATVRNMVAYLADAQRWARRAVVLIALLAVLLVGAAAAGPAVDSLKSGDSQPAQLIDESPSITSRPTMISTPTSTPKSTREYAR